MKPPKIDAPNYTQVPNSILGNIADGNKPVPGLMAELEGSELKVLLAICRLTFGFHQDKRRASLTTLEKLTGLSRQGVVNAAGSLVNKGLVERSYDGGVTQWRVAVKPVDYQEVEEVVNSVDYLVKSVDQTSQASGLPSNKETIKKPNKETSSKEEAKASPPLAVAIYRKIARTFPNKSLWETIDQKVGRDPVNLAFWGEVVFNYIECGWNRANIKSMLEFYERRELPAAGKPKAHGPNGHRPAVKSNQPIPMDTDFYDRWEKGQ